MNDRYLGPGMPASLRRLLPCVVLALTVPAIAGCGGGDDGRLLTRSKASELRSTLSGVESKVSAGDCTGAEQQAATLRQQVDSLSRRVKSDLRSSLANGARRLQTLVTEQCGATAETGPTGPVVTTPQQDTAKPKKEEKKAKKVPPGQEKKSPEDGTGQQDGGGTVPTPDTGGSGGGSGGSTTQP
jgi:hypothetical protein